MGILDHGNRNITGSWEIGNRTNGNSRNLESDNGNSQKWKFGRIIFGKTVIWKNSKTRKLLKDKKSQKSEPVLAENENWFSIPDQFWQQMKNYFRFTQIVHSN